MTSIWFSDRDNIVVISLHLLGDTVFTIPAINELHKEFGNRLIIFCYEHSKQIYELTFNEIKYFVVSKPNRYISSIIPPFELRHTLSKLRPQKIFDITGTIFSSLTIVAQGAEDVVGSPEKFMRGGYTHWTEKRKVPHLTDMYLEMISYNGNKYKEAEKSFHVSYNSG